MACYAQRWEIETSYRDLKTATRGPRRISCAPATPPGSPREIWALLCAAQLTHAARTHAAATACEDPDRISYTITLRAIRRAITTMTAATTITTEALATLLPPRRQRSYPLRLTLTSTTKRRAARTHLTGHTTRTITITPPATGLPSP